jgi:hypothetical protein
MLNFCIDGYFLLMATLYFDLTTAAKAFGHDRRVIRRLANARVIDSDGFLQNGEPVFSVDRLPFVRKQLATYFSK